MFDWLLFDTSLLSDPVIIFRLVLQVLLFSLSAFFSMSETALFSLSNLDLARLRDQRHHQANTIHRLLDYPRVLIVSILCGNELVNVAATVNLAGILLTLYADPDHAGWVNIMIMFPLILILGEITPKTIAIKNTYHVSANIISSPISVWVKLVKPLRVIVMIVANFLTTLIIGSHRKQENILGVDEIKTLLAEVSEQGDISATERIIIDNLLDSKDAEVVSIMIPRPRLIFLDIEKPTSELIEKIRIHKRSRFPVYKGHPDNIVGMIYTGDIAKQMHKQKDFSQLDFASILTPVVAVPTTKTIHEMLDLFRRENTTAALIFNEWGSVDGFVTLRQILRFFVGAITNTAEVEDALNQIEDDVFHVSGQMNLDRVNDLLNTDLEHARMTTIGGLVFQHLDRLPVVGDEVEFDGVKTKVLSMQRHRIDKLEITKSANFPISQDLAENDLDDLKASLDNRNAPGETQ